MLQPEIRRAGSADAEAMSALARRTFAETFGHLYPPADLATFLEAAYAPEVLRAELADRGTAAWLAWMGNAPVGYAQAGRCGLPHESATAECGELKRLYLLQGHQNLGLGRRLFETALDWLLKDGPRQVFIGVWSENVGAQRFYRRFGFEKVGEYGFHVGETVDAEYILRRPAMSFSAQPSS